MYRLRQAAPFDRTLDASGISKGAAYSKVLFFAAVAASAVILPMLFFGNASGHDFEFHLHSWMDVARQWHEGVIYPRWAAWANYGFGEPRFIFYPPGSWLLGAGLGLALPWKMVPGAFIWLVLVVAGISMHSLAREFLPPVQAIVASALYVVNPYHLVLVYYRSDFAELLASAIFPFAIGRALRIARHGWIEVIAMAAGLAGIWLANAPAGVIATYSLGLVLLVEAGVHRKWRALLGGGAAILAGFGLAAFYLFPAAVEQHWVNIAQALSANLQPQNNFLFTRSNSPDFRLFNWKVSSVAAVVAGATAIAAVFTRGMRRRTVEAFWPLVGLGVAAIVLMLPVSVLAWRFLPELRFAQFPWRWLLALDLVGVFFLAAALSRAHRKWLFGAMTAVVLVALAGAMIHDAWWDAEDVVSAAAEVRTGPGYRGTDEYAPLGCDPDDLPRSAPQVALLDPPPERVLSRGDARIQIVKWTSNDKRVEVDSAQPIVLGLKLVNYPAWRLKVNEQGKRPLSQRGTAQMLVPVGAGRSTVVVQLGRTQDQVAGDLASLGTAAVLAGVTLLGRRRRFREDA